MSNLRALSRQLQPCAKPYGIWNMKSNERKKEKNNNAELEI